MLPALAALALAAGAGAALRQRAMRRRERLCAERLPPGEGGIVRGAEPIDLRGTGPHVALLMHGFGDTPATMRYMAEHLHALGYSVRAPLLPGHGRSLPEFAATCGDDWVACARAEFAEMRRRHGAANVALVGLSMGGALASIVAAESPDLPALVLVSPYVSMPARLRRLAWLHPVVAIPFPYLPGRGEASIRDHEERARSLAYGQLTPRLLYELMRVVDRARSALPAVRVPTLVIQSREDNRIPPDACERAFALLGCVEKRLEWLAETGHIITVDFHKERVFELAAAWMGGRLPAGPGAGAREEVRSA